MNDIFCHKLHYGLLFCYTQFGPNFNDFDVIGPKATEFGRITQNYGLCTVKSHSMSSISVPMENPYATSYE